MTLGIIPELLSPNNLTLADGDCDSCVRLALTHLRADLAAARRDMYRAISQL